MLWSGRSSVSLLRELRFSGSSASQGAPWDGRSKERMAWVVEQAGQMVCLIMSSLIMLIEI